MLQLPYDPESREKGRDLGFIRDLTKLNSLAQKLCSSVHKGKTSRALRIMVKIGPIIKKVGKDRVPRIVMKMLREVM